MLLTAVFFFSKTRTGYFAPSRPVRGSWQSVRRALPGAWTVGNTDDVNPENPGNNGQGPLSDAAWNGHERVVEILLGRDDINPDKPDNDGKTPLYCAAYNGHDGVVKILLRRDDVSPAKPDIYGQTPLFWAVENGHKGTIALLQPPKSVAPRRSLKRRAITRYTPSKRRRR